jgi:formate dehydrogenase subunit beta
MPDDTATKVREIARDLLARHEVSLVIGYAQGSVPLRSKPCFARTTEDVDKLIWDATCEQNLARFLRGREDRVAIVGKGCDVGAIISLIKEKQVDRDRVVIIGVMCNGVIDRRRVLASMRGREILRAAECDGVLTLAGDGFEEQVQTQGYLSEGCLSCKCRVPVLYDAWASEGAPAGVEGDGYEQIRGFEAEPADLRWELFMAEVDKCIRCYACRGVCPVCYCPECFVDRTNPRVVGKTTDPTDTALFHLVRALHTAGRCVDCGACVRACPMGIDLRLLNRKLAKDIEELFEYRAGEDLIDLPPLATYRTDDPQGSIR